MLCSALVYGTHGALRLQGRRRAKGLTGMP